MPLHGTVESLLNVMYLAGIRPSIIMFLRGTSHLPSALNQYILGDNKPSLVYVY